MSFGCPMICSNVVAQKEIIEKYEVGELFSPGNVQEFSEKVLSLYNDVDKIKSYNKFLNSDSLNKAYNFALDAHQNQKRDEGVPYIIHPVAVANILTDLKLDSATITTGLLHDTIEDLSLIHI